MIGATLGQRAPGSEEPPSRAHETRSQHGGCRWTRDPRGDDGTIVLWLLGLCVILLFVGGLSLDLWRVLADRRALAGMADAASIAGATALDEVAFRSAGEVVLDPVAAEERALASIGAQVGRVALLAASAEATPEQVSVVLEGSTELTLLRILAPGPTTIPLRVEAIARPGAR